MSNTGGRRHCPPPSHLPARPRSPRGAVPDARISVPFDSRRPSRREQFPQEGTGGGKAMPGRAGPDESLALLPPRQLGAAARAGERGRLGAVRTLICHLAASWFVSAACACRPYRGGRGRGTRCPRADRWLTVDDVPAEWSVAVGRFGGTSAPPCCESCRRRRAVTRQSPVWCSPARRSPRTTPPRSADRAAPPPRAGRWPLPARGAGRRDRGDHR